jgi:hypothetical protein
MEKASALFLRDFHKLTLDKMREALRRNDMFLFELEVLNFIIEPLDKDNRTDYVIKVCEEFGSLVFTDDRHTRFQSINHAFSKNIKWVLDNLEKNRKLIEERIKESEIRLTQEQIAEQLKILANRLYIVWDEYFHVDLVVNKVYVSLKHNRAVIRYEMKACEIHDCDYKMPYDFNNRMLSVILLRDKLIVRFYNKDVDDIIRDSLKSRGDYEDDNYDEGYLDISAVLSDIIEESLYRDSSFTEDILPLYKKDENILSMVMNREIEESIVKEWTLTISKMRKSHIEKVNELEKSIKNLKHHIKMT